MFSNNPKNPPSKEFENYCSIYAFNWGRGKEDKTQTSWINFHLYFYFMYLVSRSESRDRIPLDLYTVLSLDRIPID
jgi:hypothetical protein